MITIENVPQTSMDLIRLILINQMGMKQDRVAVYDEKWKIPDDEEMFITIEYRNSKTIANRNIFDGTSTPPVEYQELNMIETIVVGVFSRNNESQWRKEEVLMAIRSQYAQLMQEQFSFKIAMAGNIQDLSVLEGAAMLKRYDIELMVFSWYEKKVTPGYMTPPLALKVIANDRGNGEIIRNVPDISKLPV